MEGCQKKREKKKKEKKYLHLGKKKQNTYTKKPSEDIKLLNQPVTCVISVVATVVVCSLALFFGFGVNLVF